MEINVKLLDKVIEHIKEEPRRIDMSMWREEVPKKISPCGTIGCIAGWADSLSKQKISEEAVNDYYSELISSPIGIRAALKLGLTETQASELFFTAQWPTELRRKLVQAEAEGGTRKNLQKNVAKLVIERIEAFKKQYAGKKK